jgi:hypothetical protein
MFNVLIHQKNLIIKNYKYYIKKMMKNYMKKKNLYISQWLIDHTKKTSLKITKREKNQDDKIHTEREKNLFYIYDDDYDVNPLLFSTLPPPSPV